MDAPVCRLCGYRFTAAERPIPVVYAGFWRRAAAMLVDFLVFAPLQGIFFVLLVTAQMGGAQQARSQVGAAVIVLAAFAIGHWLYHTILESSSWMGTVGKRVCGLRVTGLDGRRIGFARANGRYFAKFLSATFMSFGYLLAAFTEKKQALHDIAASTLVVRVVPSGLQSR
ncbi:MAG: RDD family protein [Bryobacterales bacterium]|nr:RDD family protein [Bryobacterales bacterium]